MNGWMKFANLLCKLSKDFWGSMKCTKFAMDEMYEIDQFLAEFKYEYDRIWLLRLCVCLVVWYVSKFLCYHS